MDSFAVQWGDCGTPTCSTLSASVRWSPGVRLDDLQNTTTKDREHKFDNP